MANYESSFTGAQIDTGIGLANSAQQPPVEGPFVNGDKSKLDGIEPLADVTDATNVEAAGALMDSEVTNLSAVKSFDPTDYATAAQGGLADSAVQPGDLAAVATSGDYDDLSNLPTLGTAAATDSTDYATAAQGGLADSAVQPGDDADTLGSGDALDSYVLTADGLGGAAWEEAGGVPGGADTQIQFNDGGAFNGDTALTWDKTTDELTVGGDVVLDDGVAGFETIVQCVPPTANQVISFPDATGIVALTSDLVNFETTTQLNSRDTANRDRANHTGTQTASTISDFSTAADARITASDKVSSDPTGVTGADQITNMMSLTQAEYDVITPDASTFYVIVG